VKAYDRVPQTFYRNSKSNPVLTKFHDCRHKRIGAHVRRTNSARLPDLTMEHQSREKRSQGQTLKRGQSGRNTSRGLNMVTVLLHSASTPSGLFPPAVYTKQCLNFSSPPSATCPAHLILLHFVIRDVLELCQRYKSWSSSLCNFLQFTATPSPSCLRFANIITPCSSPTLIHQINKLVTTAIRTLPATLAWSHYVTAWRV
jgi:hypothetical protein